MKTTPKDWISCYIDRDIIRLDKSRVYNTNEEVYDVHVYENSVFVSDVKLKSGLQLLSADIMKEFNVTNYVLKYEWHRAKLHIINLPVFNGVYKCKLAFRCDYISRKPSTNEISIVWHLVQVEARIIDYFK